MARWWGFWAVLAVTGCGGGEASPVARADAGADADAVVEPWPDAGPSCSFAGARGDVVSVWCFGPDSQLDLTAEWTGVVTAVIEFGTVVDRTCPVTLTRSSATCTEVRALEVTPTTTAPHPVTSQGVTSCAPPGCALGGDACTPDDGAGAATAGFAVVLDQGDLVLTLSGPGTLCATYGFDTTEIVAVPF